MDQERNEVYALKSINLEIARGDFVTIIGTNGSGKSTLLNAVGGNFLPDSGTITIAGEDVTDKKDYQRAAAVSRVFQNPFMGTAPNNPPAPSPTAETSYSSPSMYSCTTTGKPHRAAIELKASTASSILRQIVAS